MFILTVTMETFFAWDCHIKKYRTYNNINIIGLCILIFCVKCFHLFENIYSTLLYLSIYLTYSYSKGVTSPSESSHTNHSSENPVIPFKYEISQKVNYKFKQKFT